MQTPAPTAYSYYFKSEHEKLVNEDCNNLAEITASIRARWNELTAQEREPFEKMRLEHIEKFENQMRRRGRNKRSRSTDEGGSDYSLEHQEESNHTPSSEEPKKLTQNELVPKELPAVEEMQERVLADFDLFLLQQQEQHWGEKPMNKKGNRNRRQKRVDTE